MHVPLSHCITLVCSVCRLGKIGIPRIAEPGCWPRGHQLVGASRHDYISDPLLSESDYRAKSPGSKLPSAMMMQCEAPQVGHWWPLDR